MFARMTSRRAQARRAARVLHQQPVQVAGEELRILMARVEDLVDRLGTAADPELRRLRKRAEVALANARDAVAEGGAQLGAQVRDLAEHGDEYVRSRPWTSIGLVAFAMLAIGLWAARSTMSD